MPRRMSRRCALEACQPHAGSAPLEIGPGATLAGESSHTPPPLLGGAPAILLGKKATANGGRRDRRATRASADATLT